MARKRMKRKKIGAKTQFFATMGMVAAIIFLPTTLFLGVGMLPTVVALLTDKTKSGSKGLTVGAMNLAGCAPFLLDLWMSGHNVDQALAMISDPLTIVIVYGAASVGYMINWSLSGIISALIVQRSNGRIDDIQKRHEALIERWGEEVTGRLALDAEGFPLPGQNEKKDPEATAQDP